MKITRGTVTLTMEVTRLGNKISGFQDKIASALKHDITSLLTKMSLDFDVCFRGTKDRVSTEMLLNYALGHTEDTTSVCGAITKKGQRCPRKAQEGSAYCKTHVANAAKGTSDNSQTEHIVFTLESPPSATGPTEKKFIEDSVYLVDDEYIYHPDTKKKVGYIDIDFTTGEPEYIFTNDPFVLN